MSKVSHPETDYDLTKFSLKGEDLESFNGKYENLVFEGGGIRGIAFGGVLKFFEEHDLMHYVKRVAGSSAGAIVAGAIAVNCTADEIIKILDETNFEDFKDDSWGLVLDAYRFFNEFGIYKGDKFLEWFKNIVKEKTGNPDITFKQIYEQYGKELIITGTCLNRAKTYYFHHEKWPDMPVALAVRISMSIPLVFKAVRLHTKEPKLDEDGNTITDEDGNPVMEEFEDIMVDGGLLNNYPIWVFDGESLRDIDKDTMEHSKTLGFKLMSSDEKPDNQLYHYYQNIGNIIDYMKAFIDSMTIQIERGHIRDGYWDKTVSVNTGTISTLDFAISDKDKQTLIKSGYESAKNHFYCHLKHIPNEWNNII
mgnify:CR=1 FL=1